MKQFLQLKIDNLKPSDNSFTFFFYPLLSDLEKPFSRSFAPYPGHPPDKNEHGVEWNQVRPFIKFPKCAQYPDRERVETRAPFSPLAKTTRWVILPTCSYSYEHAVLLITSNYNTWSQCILRYANLVSRPLVLTPVALEEGKRDKWAATNRIMHKRSRFPEDIWPGLPLLFTWKTLWEIGSRISMLVYRCAEIQPIFMTAVDRNAVRFDFIRVESFAQIGGFVWKFISSIV